jgi:hypothetical protein
MRKNSIKKKIVESFLKIKNQKTTTIIGCVLLVLPFFSIISFIVDVIPNRETIIFSNWYTKFFWWGSKYKPSLLPIYFGLMAIAGAYLIKKNS